MLWEAFIQNNKSTFYHTLLLGVEEEGSIQGYNSRIEGI